MMSEERNPYDSRNHESQPLMGKDDIYAVAGLLGHVSGSLKDIDTKNVGGDSPYIKANKTDPKEVLKQMVTQSTVPPSPIPVTSPNPATSPQVTVQQESQITNNIDGHHVELSNLIKRLDKIERVLESKIDFKFKRGVSYTINSTKIKGVFKDPQDIVDVVLSEMSKQTKTITLKLNDTNKNN